MENKEKTGLTLRLARVPQTVMDYLKRPQVWGFFVSLAVIALLSIAFFHPDASEGNQLRQHDMQQGAAIGQEVKAFLDELSLIHISEPTRP